MSMAYPGFYLNPKVDIIRIIDITVGYKVNIYWQATEKLSDELFYSVPEDLYQFIKILGYIAT